MQNKGKEGEFGKVTPTAQTEEVEPVDLAALEERRWDIHPSAPQPQTWCTREHEKSAYFVH